MLARVHPLVCFIWRWFEGRRHKTLLGYWAPSLVVSSNVVFIFPYSVLIYVESFHFGLKIAAAISFKVDMS